MVMAKVKSKQEKVIDLTDIGKHNKMSESRIPRQVYLDTANNRIEYDPNSIPDYVLNNELVPTSTTHDGQQQKQRPAPVKKADQSDIPIIMAVSEDRNKGQAYPEPYQPTDPEPYEEQHLENLGATVINSTTYFPESGVTINKRSQTHDEIADERGYPTR
jgi:hypothetical protein